VSRRARTEAGIIRVGERIGHLRGQAGLSLRELAERSGVSFATIQKIENNAIVPSVATLLKIAQSLGRTVGFFLDEPLDDERTLVLTRKPDRAVTPVPASRLTIEDVGLSLRNALLQATLLTIGPGGESGEEPLLHPGEEVKFCLKGRLEYCVGGKAYLLKAGDCLHFKSDVPHRWRNPGTEDAVIFSVCTPPPFFTNTSLSRATGGRPRNGR
jgi:transcriptional regulator with XRE-family HTH domain